jgi:hypothetical protein
MAPRAMAAMPFGQPPAAGREEEARRAPSPARTVPRPAASAPMPPPYAAPAPYPPPARSESAAESEQAIDLAAYLAQLGALASELEAQAHGGADAAVLRRLRQRLTEWIEDLRSVGGHGELAGVVELAVARLTAALAAGTGVAAEAATVAAELTRLATSGSPPRSTGRPAFWK